MENGGVSGPPIRVVIHNDDVTPCDFVVSLLVDVFGLSEADAARLALRTHWRGSATVATLPPEASAALLAAANERIAASPYPLALSLEPATDRAATEPPTSVPLVPIRKSEPTIGIVPTIARSMSDAVRALFFRRVALQPAPVHGGAVAVIAALAVVAEVVFGWIANGTVTLPSAWGLTSSVAQLGLLACGLLLLSGKRRAFDVAAAFSLVVCTTLLVNAVGTLAAMLLDHASPMQPGNEATLYLLAGLSIVPVVWWFAAVAVLGRRFVPVHRLRGAFGFVAVALLSAFLLPSTPPVSSARNFAGSSSLVELAFDLVRPPRESEWEIRQPVDVEGTYARQPSLLATSLDALLPSRKDRSELYFVSVGAYAEQDVFLREASSARNVFDQRMGTDGRSLLLVNNRQTVDSLPLANATNLQQVMDRLAQVMDPDKDVLVLFLTSHGSEEALSVSFDGFSFNDLTPERLKEVLAGSKVRHRVVIVSACHSGAFVPALESKETLVITAARADRTSFGCSNEREWTYFGDAFFNHALRRTRSLVEAFDLARAEIIGWEKRDGLTPSEPQISAGEDVTARLRDISAALDDDAAGEPAGSKGASLERDAADVR